MTLSKETQALLNSQGDIGKQIDRAAVNFGKDGASRKTIQYLQRRLQNLTNLWYEFEENHNELTASTDIPLSDNYFTGSYKNKIEKIVFQLQKDIEQTALQLYPGQDIFSTQSGSGGNTSGSGNVPPVPPGDEKRYAMNIININLMLTSFSDSLDEFGAMDPTLKTPETLSENHQRLKTKWRLIQELHSRLIQKSEKYDANQYLDVENKLKTFLPVIGNIDINIAGPNPPINAHRGTIGVDIIKLPKITIPKFEGDYAKWHQFSELFNEMVGSSSISGTQKLMYLKQNIHGEAAKLVNHLLLTEANYDVAWDILRARYDNKRLIITALLEKIFMVEPIKQETSEAVKKLHDTVAENIRVLRSMNINQADLSSIMLHYLVLKKLDDSSHQLYEQTLADSKATQGIDQLLAFMVKRFQALEAVGKKSKPANLNRSYTIPPKSPQKSVVLLSAKGEKSSKLCKCKQNHPIYKCTEFLMLSPKARYSRVKESNRCFVCLKTGHSKNECTGRKCDKCDKQHNSLLHFERGKALLGSAIKNTGFQHVFLATVIINVLDQHGNPIKLRALLDSGSQLNIMTEKMHKKLGIEYQPAHMTIEGIGASEVEAKKRSVIQIESQHSSFKAALEVFIVRKITTCQPATEIDISSWTIPSNIQLADKKFNIPANVDLTIGGEIFFTLISKGLITIGQNLPQLQNTVFGWIVIGKLLGLERNTAFSGIGIKKETTLDRQVNKFWQMEEKFKEAEPVTQEEEWCEQFYNETTKRDKTGRFIVRLQFSKEPTEVIGKSEDMAIRRFLYLEKRFQRDPQLREEYVSFMEEYEKLGHMQITTKEEFGKQHYFIPHHFVRNPASSTTKFRVVFDASAKSTSNKSLNEILLNGPILQDDLFSIMTRFRKHEYVFSGDIGKMYRQIVVHPEDQRWQLIVWRSNPLDELKHYKLKTVTYGTTCASYLAIKSLQTLADIEKNRFPLASIVAKRDFNVDDVMSGTDDIKEAVQLQQELIEMLKLAGMNLHKWCSNHPMLLENIPKNKQEVSLDINAEKTETKALGMKWIPKEDVFMLHYNPKGHTKITKRTILSETAQLFDPLGLVNPVIVLAKIFMQELWIKRIDWDESLPIEMQEKWSAFREELTKLNYVSIPRHMIATEAVNVQLHAFSDASMRAYGTVIYVRSTYPTGEVIVNLVCSKSRVALVNILTLPRLELCGAVIMVDLVEKLKQTLNMKFDEIKLWTDSEIVLSWIYTDGTYKTFVGNRIARLRRKTQVQDWRYINTKSNPADLISRGVFPEKLLESNLWWHGPEFLKQQESEWPSNKSNFVREECEERVVKTVLVATVKVDTEHVIDRIKHRNSIDTLQRVLAYCIKFGRKGNEVIKKEPSATILNVSDLERAMTEIIRYSQKKHLKEDYNHIKNGHPEKTKFSNLSPIIDKFRIIRVGGRLQASELSFEQKHPALLPKEDKFTRLIMERIHLKNMHAGPQALLATTRQQYWPINGKKIAQSIVQQCVLCARHKPKLLEQVMGILPSERVEGARPFIHVGVDFAGPIMVHHQIRGKKPTKAYICLFVCFSTKAVHIEAATDMSTEAFINCLKRFIARRGLPSKIFSDNGSNFIGAKNQLEELSIMITDPQNQAEVIKYCWDHSIEWKFSPPRSPHFGGLWESAIKSAKLHLIKTLHNYHCTYSELSTILAEIESILNSRPLTPMSNNPNDLQPLTAGHFLIGAPMRCINDQLLPTGSKVNTWTKLRAIKSEFWKRWSKEYFAELQYRHKWKKEQKNIKVGTLVTIKDDNLPPLHWRMGRIESVIPDASGNIRVVMVKTEKGIKKRAIHELCPLPVEDAIRNENSGIKDSNHEDACKDEFEGTPIRPEWPNLKAEAVTPENKNIEEVTSGMTRKQTKLLQSAIEKIELPLVRPEWATLKSKPPIDEANDTKNVTSRVTRSQTKLLRSSDKKQNEPSVQVTKGKKRQPVKQKETVIESGRTTRSVRHYGATSLGTAYIVIVSGFLSVLLGVFGNECNVTSFVNNPGLYFEEIGQLSLTSDDWIIVSYIKMQTYWQEAENINKTIKIMEGVCKETHPDDFCEANIQQFRHQFNSINEKNELLAAFSSPERSRKKRGWFDAGGKAAKEIFGILNEDDAKHYDEQIEQVQLNSAHLMNLIRNQTTIQEITSNIIKRDEVMMVKRFEYIQREIDSMKGKDIVGKMNLFNSLSLQTITLLSGYREIQSTILDLLLKVYHGKIPPTVITPMRLKNHLMNITNHIPPALMIPGSNRDNQISKLYTMLTTQARITGKNLIVRIKLPLISREYFKLYYTTPVPFVTPKSLRIISPTTNYLGVNLKQDHYYMLPDNEREQCKVYEDGHLICEQKQPLYAVHQNTTQCEIVIMLHPNESHEQCEMIETGKHQFWSSLSKQNQYLFTMQDPTSISIICNTEREKTVQHCSLNGSGILSLEQQCMIKSGTMEISSYNTLSSIIQPEMLIPPRNISDIMKSNRMANKQTTVAETWDNFEMDPQFEALRNALRVQRSQEQLNTINNHHVHHYVLTYALSFIIFVILVGYCCQGKIRLCMASMKKKKPVKREFELEDIHIASNSRFSDPVSYQTIAEAKV